MYNRWEMTMRKRFTMLAMVALAFGLVTGAIAPPTALANDAGKTQPMYRCYNPNSGEHFYTASEQERDHIVSVGWRYEGVGWTAPGKSSTPVYRLYNPNAGDHHYTTSLAERDHLVKVGWRYEGVGWYSSDTKLVPLYRQYNPNAVTGTHNYTTSKGENDYLVKVGWRAEGIGWYGVGGGTYTVKFVTETDQGTKVVSEQKLKIGQAVQLPDNPTRDRYEFRGWGDGVSDGMTCQGDATYEAVWAPDDVDSTSGDYGTQLSYMDNTKSVTGTVSADGKSATIPTEQARQLEKDDIVVVNPTDPYAMTAIKVDKVTQSGGSTVVSGEKANPVDYVKQLSMKSDPQQSGDWMFVPESELEAAGASRPTRRPSLGDAEVDLAAKNDLFRTKAGIKSSATGKTFTGEFTRDGLTKKITTEDVRKYLGLKDGESSNLSVDASITVNPKINVDIDYNYLKGFTKLQTDFDIGADVNAKISNSTNADGEHLIYRLGVFYSPDPEVPLVFQLFATFHADGSVELTASPEETVSVALQNWRFKATRKDSLGNPTITANANAKIGIMPSLALGWKDLTVADIDLEGGAAGKAKLTQHFDPTLQCIDLNAWFYLNLNTAQCDGLEKSVLEFHKQLTGDEVPVSLNLVDESDSPLKGSWHFEDGKKVPKCTWVISDAKAKGLVVLTGTVRKMTGDEACNLCIGLGLLDPSALDWFRSHTDSYGKMLFDTYTLFVLDEPQEIEWDEPGEGMSTDGLKTYVIKLPNEMGSYDGQHVTAAFDNKKGGWPSQANPIGKSPSCYSVEILDVG